MLALNVLHFARTLRRAGLPVGPADMLAAEHALTVIEIGDRAQVRAGLRAAMVHRHEHRAVFDQAFALFWRDPEAVAQAAALALLAGEEGPASEPEKRAGSRRVAEAFAPPRPERAQPPPETVSVDAAMTVSEREQLQAMDFEAMDASQVAAARAEMRRLALPLDRRRTRRLRPHPAGPLVDMAATLRGSLRQGGEVVRIARAARVVRPPPLVVLCDISGSMARYAQILLFFLHAVANDRDRVHVFLFGTRLSNISRQLRHRDPEAAFETVAQVVPDWSGGTRIGETVAEFNRTWSRRVLGQGAVVLLVTDGLDRPQGEAGMAELGAAMDRLHRSCRRLIWLNPLLRWDGFRPRSQSIRAMLPHVDEFRTVHNLASLRDLVSLLSAPAGMARGGDPGRFAP